MFVTTYNSIILYLKEFKIICLLSWSELTSIYSWMFRAVPPLIPYTTLYSTHVPVFLHMYNQN
jgi:hypothetical protein